MKLLFRLILLPCFIHQATAKEPAYKTPLSKYSKEWDNPKYEQCNTAEHANYMSKEEKEIIWILNMARVNPRLFRKTILPLVATLTTTDTSSPKYYKSLDSTMRVMKALGVLKPDSMCARSARAHAMASAATGYCGHVRQTPESRKVVCFGGECCYNGSTDPLTIILVLLVDDYVESLGHRHICFGNFTRLGAGLAPIAHHHAYKNPRAAAVLDFHY